MEKERVDLLVVQQGLTDSREKAKRLIMAGQIIGVDNQVRYDKPGEKIDRETPLRIRGQVMPYVSRGGLKLEKALKVFGVDLQDRVVLDIGASTGGFTDAALQNGAKLVYALDVGYNQLDYKLRQDPRVIVMERTNFRYSQAGDFTHGQVEFASIDVSFISLQLILPPLVSILQKGGRVLALIKPQFEAGKDRVGKKGIVSNPQVHSQVLEEVLTFADSLGFRILGLTFSPITGGSGNIEFLVDLCLGGDQEGIDWLAAIGPLVQEAHQTLR